MAGLPVLLDVAAKLLEAHNHRNMAKLPGSFLETKIGRLTFELNASNAEQRGIPPWTLVISDDFPLALVDPGGGVTVNCDEGDLIEELRELMPDGARVLL